MQNFTTELPKAEMKTLSLRAKQNVKKLLFMAAHGQKVTIKTSTHKKSDTGDNNL